MEAGALNITEHDPGNPREIFRLLWRRRRILLVCIVLIPVATYLYSAQLPKSYLSSTVLQVQAVADASSVLSGNSSGSASDAGVAKLAETSGVTDEAARQLGLPVGSLRGSVAAVADEDTGFITLTTTADSARGAAATANAAAKALNSTREKTGVERANEAIAGVERDLRKLPRGPKNSPQRLQLTDQLQRLRTLRAAQGSNATVVEPAGVPGAPASPNPRRNAILAFVLSLLAGVGLVILVDRMDRRLRDADEVEKLVGVPLLAVISIEAFPGGRPTKSSALAFQTLRDSLTYFNVDEALTIIAVTSPLKGEGKTTVATNLAVSLARANKKVILVDADLRRPQVGKRMGVDERRGLSSVLLGADLEESLQEVSPFGSRLRILAAGPKPPNPSELIGSKRMSALLTELTELSDVVVIDTTPLLVVSDAFPLLDQVSGTVGIARLDQTPREAVQRMVEITTTAGGRVFGMVATGAKGGSLRGYDYGYGYESEMPIVGVTPTTGGNGAGPGDEVSVSEATLEDARNSKPLKAGSTAEVKDVPEPEAEGSEQSSSEPGRDAAEPAPARKRWRRRAGAEATRVDTEAPAESGAPDPIANVGADAAEPEAAADEPRTQADESDASPTEKTPRV